MKASLLLLLLLALSSGRAAQLDSVEAREIIASLDEKAKNLSESERETLNHDIRWIGFCLGVIAVADGKTDEEIEKTSMREIAERVQAAKSFSSKVLAAYSEELIKRHPGIYERFKTREQFQSKEAHTGVKAFGDLYFGETKERIEKRAPGMVKVGERLFTLTPSYETIKGTERLSRINLTATWTDTDPWVIKQNVKEIRGVLSEKFGEPKWSNYDYVDTIPTDDLFSPQLTWEVKEEKAVTVWLRERNYETERKQTVQTAPGNFLRAAKTEEISTFDKHREFIIWIEIKSPMVDKMKFREASSVF